ncbi:hypothetical protein ACROYT_G006234 [Oculina patagonica]
MDGILYSKRRETVSCLLVGERDDSGICILKDENRPTFQQGSANSFMISVSGSLGTITSLRVWHDNYGLSPAWFLKRVLVRNLQSDACAVFIGERWFALDEDDGAIMHKLTPADEKDLTTFSRLFNSELYKDFTDAHLWFSVLLKPAKSTFTRAQRASCCLCLLSSEDVGDTSGKLREKSNTNKWGCCPKGKIEMREGEEKNEAEAKKKKKAEGFLPNWCLYIAWVLCIGASFTSALYTLFYSMMWGTEKSNQWFFSMMLSFSQDILINQPAKVLFLSTAYAIFIRKSDEESDAEHSNEDPRKGRN